GRDQCPQPFIDLPVHPFTPLLDGEHHQQADTDADECEQGDADQSDQKAVPGCEVKATHLFFLVAAQSMPFDLAGIYLHTASSEDSPHMIRADHNTGCADETGKPRIFCCRWKYSAFAVSSV